MALPGDPHAAPRVLLAGLPAELANWLGARLTGAAVEAAPTGTAALAALEQGSWALLVLDDRLADPPARDVLQQVRAASGAAPLPVLYCLDRGAAASEARALVATLGVHRLLFQPLDR